MVMICALIPVEAGLLLGPLVEGDVQRRVLDLATEAMREATETRAAVALQCSLPAWYSGTTVT